MPIYGLRLRAPGQTIYYNAPDTAAKGGHALIESEQGILLADIVSGPLDILPGIEAENLPCVHRVLEQDDEETLENNEQLGKQAFSFCRERILERQLDMKLVDVEVFFDKSKIIFYFTAPNRIDFRELVKDLVREYRARIELRQIGVRHETQMIGAIGNCGQVCCCRNYLRKFAPVTIKMAKEQNLFLNPSKISGICGRLLCCLSYEQDNYEKFHKMSPRPGKKYLTRKGLVKILRVNMFKNSVSALFENNDEQEMSLDEWKALDPKRPPADALARNEDEKSPSESEPGDDSGF